MPKSFSCTSSKLIYIVFKKEMLQAAHTDRFDPLATKAHNSECPKSSISFTNLSSGSQFKSLKVQWKLGLKLRFADFYFLHPRQH